MLEISNISAAFAFYLCFIGNNLLLLNAVHAVYLILSPFLLMLNSIKTTLTNAPSRIYNKAAATVNSAKSKIGEFHNRAVAPKVAGAKEQLTSLKTHLSSKYDQLWSRFSKNESRTEDSKSTVGNRNADVTPQVEEQTSPTQPKNWNCTVRSVETDVEALRSQFESKTLSTQELYDKLTGLAAEARDANQLGSVLNLVDDVLKSDAPGTGLQHLNTLDQLKNAITASPLKGDSTTLNHVKHYFKSQTSQTKNFSELEPSLQTALKEGLAQKGANPPT